MKKKLICFLLMISLIGSLSFSAFAEATDPIVWSVVCGVNGKLTPEKGYDISKALSGLQPGDSLTITINLKNEYTKSVDWYMKNKVVESLEKSANDGGGYSYRLVYIKSPSGSATEEVIFDSDTVGGENSVLGRHGLTEATAGLEDYFKLDTFTSGQTSQVKLTVTLDPETIGDAYQDTNGDLFLQFAVSFVDTDKRTVIVRTGDEHSYTPFFIAMIVSGLGFLYLALDSVTDRMYGVSRKKVRR